MDFDFVSNYRNRNMWPNPCLYEVSFGSGQSNGLNALDPISNQAPVIEWRGQKISHYATITAATTGAVVLSIPENWVNYEKDYYSGAELHPLATRINSSIFLGQKEGLAYFQMNVAPSKFKIGDSVLIQITHIPNTIFVPGGSDLPHAYNKKLLYNQTNNEWVKITGYYPEFRRVVAEIPPHWKLNDMYSIRDNLPYATYTFTEGGNTPFTLNLKNIKVNINPGDFIRIISTKQYVKIINFDKTTSTVTVSPRISEIISPGDTIEILTQTSDNHRSPTNIVGQERLYRVTLVSGTLPNILIRNGYGGYPTDYPFLYVEFHDTNYPFQSNVYTNNHITKNYFKMSPVGQFKAGKKFTKFIGEPNHKIIKLRSASTFRIVWRLPTGEEIIFDQDDTTSPLAPKETIQTSIQIQFASFDHKHY